MVVRGMSSCNGSGARHDERVVARLFDDGRGGLGAVVRGRERRRCHGTLGEVVGVRGCEESMASDVPLPRTVPSKLGEGGEDFFYGGRE
jgi:hypothetical protein